MDEVWTTGRRHVKISKLYVKRLMKRGPNIFVALAWSQESRRRLLLLRAGFPRWGKRTLRIQASPCVGLSPRTQCVYTQTSAMALSLLLAAIRFLHHLAGAVNRDNGPHHPSCEMAFWLILEATAGNENSHGFVRLSSVVCYALALHTGGHLMLHRYSSGAHKLGHSALEFLLDLTTDVVGFAWINVAEEMLAQIFEVRAKTTFTYAVLAFLASLGSMEIGSMSRGLLGWSVDCEETATQFDAGSFALPTSWLVTQGVHIGLYGFFYRTAGGQGGQGRGGGRGGADDVVDIRVAASFFLLAYALLCSILATRVIGGTVAASAVAVNDRITSSGSDVSSCSSSGSCSRGDLLIQAISSYEVTAAQASDAVDTTATTARASSSSSSSAAAAGAAAAAAAAVENQQLNSRTPHRGADYCHPRRLVALPGRDGGDGKDDLPADVHGDEQRIGDEVVLQANPRATPGRIRRRDHLRRGEDGVEEEACYRAVLLPAAANDFDSEAIAEAETGRARREFLRRGIKAYMRLTIGMMVGWAYNLWGQVEFRQEELEFRFGPALGAVAYATLSTGFGLCLLVRGTDKLGGSSKNRRRRGGDGVGDRAATPAPGSPTGGGGVEMGLGPQSEEEAAVERANREAVRSFHAKRLMVVVGGFSLVVGWAWEEAFDLLLEGLVGDEANAETVVLKLAVAVVSTAIVFGREVRAAGRHDPHGVQAGMEVEAGDIATTEDDGLLEHDTRDKVARQGGLRDDLLEPLVAKNERRGDT